MFGHPRTDPAKERLSPWFIEAARHDRELKKNNPEEYTRRKAKKKKIRRLVTEAVREAEAGRL